MIIENSTVLGFEEFLEEVWDYVSENVVTDAFYRDNIDLIREITFRLYQLFKGKIVEVESNIFETRLTTKECGRILEDTFSAIISFGVNP
jgi:hypothetical protein